MRPCCECPIRWLEGRLPVRVLGPGKRAGIVWVQAGWERVQVPECLLTSAVRERSEE